MFSEENSYHSFFCLGEEGRFKNSFLTFANSITNIFAFASYPFAINILKTFSLLKHLWKTNSTRESRKWKHAVLGVIHRARAYRETVIQISKEITVAHLPYSYSGDGYTQKKSNSTPSPKTDAKIWKVE